MKSATKKDIENLNNTKHKVLIIGGGATGAGIAVDSMSRGFSTVLLEMDDFAKGTSSRATKILHGGVRYLAQANIKLVRHALKEKMRLYNNAPHIAYSLNFIIPTNSLAKQMFYGAGMLAYDVLAGFKVKYLSKWFGKDKLNAILPNLSDYHSNYAVQYNDGQFDDARLNLAAIQTFVESGGIAINYCKVVSFIKENNKIIGVTAHHQLLDITFNIYADVVFNATGIFTDEINKLDGENKPTVTLSQGVHLVVNYDIYNSPYAILIPETKDGRVLFCIPWYNKVIIGTTDTAIAQPITDPIPQKQEIELIIQTVNEYFKVPLQKKDITSIYAGVRPLVKSTGSTSSISREEKITISKAGLISLIGGKWTTFRLMGEEAVDFAIKHNLLEHKECVTYDLKLYGYVTQNEAEKIPTNYRVYGSNYYKLQAMEGFNEVLHADLPITKAQIIWALENEMAQTLEDVLARRTRCLFLNAQATIDIAPQVARIMQKYLNLDDNWYNNQLEIFKPVANLYLPAQYL